MFSTPTQPSLPAAGLLHHLNPEQLAAVTLPPEHALILAGAGSEFYRSRSAFWYCDSKCVLEFLGRSRRHG